MCIHYSYIPTDEHYKIKCVLAFFRYNIFEILNGNYRKYSIIIFNNIFMVWRVQNWISVGMSKLKVPVIFKHLYILIIFLFSDNTY